MIAITTIDGVLRIHAEVKIPSAECGQWSPSRIGRLAELITKMVAAGEFVDSETSMLDETVEASHVQSNQAVR
jgi:hypothetical protein